LQTWKVFSSRRTEQITKNTLFYSCKVVYYTRLYIKKYTVHIDKICEFVVTSGGKKAFINKKRRAAFQMDNPADHQMTK
jgi:Holliday junction resolvase